MAQQAKVVKVGPGGRNNGPRPKVENPGKVFKRILAYVMSRYKAQVIVVLCCILLAVFAQLQGVMFSQTLIDGYILPLLNSGSTDFSGLAAAIARVAAFYCVGICAVFVQNRLMAKITQGTLKDLRDEMFTHMQTLPIKYFDTHAHGDIMSVYTNDIDTLRQMISQSLPQLVNTIVTIIGVLFSMIYLSIPPDAAGAGYGRRYAVGNQVPDRKFRQVLHQAAAGTRQGQRLYRGNDERPEGRQGFLP